MASLDDIWDTPAESVSTQPASASVIISDDEDAGPAPKPKKPRQALFLDSDSDDGGAAASGSARYASKPSTSKPDIDAFWNDLDDDPEMTFQDLAPSLDVEALKRQAAAKHALTPHQILPSSSPPRDLGDDEDGEGKDKDKGRKGKSGGGGPKKKRPVLDHERLLGEDGFPALIKQAKQFKPKGKGHELSDLSRLLNVYHFWGHRMYPNTQFSDTVQRVEKLCHSKRMHVAIGVWRDEDKGLINGHDINGGSGSDSDKDSDKDDEDAASRPADVPVATEDERSSPSLGPSAPPSSASEAGFDDFDIDAMIREEEEASHPHASTSAPAAAKAPAASAPVDEDEAMWDALMSDFPDEPFAPEERPPPPPPPAPKLAAQPPPSADEDEEMWDMVREMEMEAEANVKATAPAPIPALPPPAGEGLAQPSASGIVGQDPTRRATNDEGWDEMYS